MVDRYPLTVEFERAVAFLAATSATFMGRVGHAVDPDRVTDESARLVLAAARAHFVEAGRGPASMLVVVQRLRSEMHEGRVTYEQLCAAREALEESADAPSPADEGAVTTELVPVLRRELHRDAAVAAQDDYANQRDFSRTVELTEKAARLGAVDESVGHKVGVDAAAEIRLVQTLDKLPIGEPELDLKLGGGLRRGCLGIFLAGTGDGKCHRAGQGILLYSGEVRRVEDIRVGDLLMGPDGAPRTVLRTNTGTGPMFEVQPVRGARWAVNADHLLTLVHTTSGKTVDVAVHEWLTWSKKQRHLWKLFKPTQAVAFGVLPTDLPIDPYFLGVLLGDGSLGETIGVTTPDAPILDEVHAQAKKFGLRVHTSNGGRTAPTYYLSGTPGLKNPIMSHIERLGLRGRTCDDKFIPTAYKVAPIDDRLALLAGLVDTDGNANRSAYEYVSKSPRLAQDVAFVARSLGFEAVVTSMLKGCQTGAVGTYYRVSVVGDAVHRVPCRVAHKVLAPRRQKKCATRRGFMVEPTCTTEMFYGFTLDGDGRYLLDDFTVTHNSQALGHVAATGWRRGLFVAYATLELAAADVLARVEANMTGMLIDEVIADPDGAERLVVAAGGGGLLRVQEFSPLATTFPDVAAWVATIERLEKRKVDLLVTDYGDKLAAPKKKSDENGYRTGLVVFEAMRAWAKDGGRWHWTASQAQRRKDKKALDCDDTADSMHKARVADLMISLNLDQDTREITFKVAKARHSGGGFVVGPMATDYARGRLVPLAGKADKNDDWGLP